MAGKRVPGVVLEQHEASVRCQRPANLGEQADVIFRRDMVEHAGREHQIEARRRERQGPPVVAYRIERADGTRLAMGERAGRDVECRQPRVRKGALEVRHAIAPPCAEIHDPGWREASGGHHPRGFGRLIGREEIRVLAAQPDRLGMLRIIFVDIGVEFSLRHGCPRAVRFRLSGRRHRPPRRPGGGALRK